MRKPVSRVFRGVLVGMLLAGIGAAGAADAQLTNAGVREMVSAKIAPQIIVMTIQSSPSRFDTSPDQLVRLTRAGVPQDVIAAMVAAGGGSGTGAAGGAAAAAAGGPVAVGQVMMVDGGKRTNMQYTAGTLRTAVRGLGFGGAATYAALPGPRAQLRIAGKRPAFDVAIPSNARPEGYVTLARFEQRKNGTREVSIAGGGGFSYSTGIHPDRIVATTVSPVSGGAPSGHTVYRFTPSQDLAPGEYALVSTAAQAQGGGFGQSAAAGSYFDFGVD